MTRRMSALGYASRRRCAGATSCVFSVCFGRLPSCPPAAPKQHIDVGVGAPIEHVDIRCPVPVAAISSKDRFRSEPIRLLW